MWKTIIISHDKPCDNNYMCLTYISYKCIQLNVSFVNSLEPKYYNFFIFNYVTAICNDYIINNIILLLKEIQHCYF